MDFPPFGQMDSKHLLYMVVDMQEYLLDQAIDADGHSGAKDRLIKANVEALEWASKNSVKVYVVESSDCGKIIKPLQKVLKGNYRRVEKRGFSIAENPHLLGWLSEDKIRYGMTGGVSSGVCHMLANHFLLKNGFSVYLPQNTHASIPLGLDRRIRVKLSDYKDLMKMPDYGFPWSLSTPLVDYPEFYTSDATLADWLGLFEAAKQGEANYERAVGALGLRFSNAIPACPRLAAA